MVLDTGSIEGKKIAIALKKLLFRWKRLAIMKKRKGTSSCGIIMNAVRNKAECGGTDVARRGVFSGVAIETVTRVPSNRSCATGNALINDFGCPSGISESHKGKDSDWAQQCSRLHVRSSVALNLLSVAYLQYQQPHTMSFPLGVLPTLFFQGLDEFREGWREEGISEQSPATLPKVTRLPPAC